MEARTNIVIDTRVVREAMRLTGARTMRDVVQLALETLIEQRKRKDLRTLRGKIRFTAGYDPARTRAR